MEKPGSSHLLSLLVCELVDIQVHIPAKLLNRNGLLIIDVPHPIPACVVCSGQGRGRNQLFHECNERIQSSENNMNKTSPSMAFLVGVPHYAEMAVNVLIENS